MLLKRKHLFLMTTLLFSVIIWTCDDQTTESEIKTEEALVSWKGDFAADGCGYWIHIDLTRYKVDNETIIGDEFKSDSLMKAVVKYEYIGIRNQYPCGMSPSTERIQFIHLHSIEKVN
jgi:hypothetical protein